MSTNLTTHQAGAVELRGKHAIISAGAGTGKTRVLVERVVQLIRRGEARLEDMLVLTFTEKAAGEIKQRLSDRLHQEKLTHARQELESAAVSTFHGFAARLLREHPVEAGCDPDFRVLESEESDLLMEDALDEWIAQLFESSAPGFRFFETYGEPAARESILDVYAAARREGGNLTEYFSTSRKKRIEKNSEFENKINALAEKVFQPIADKVNQAEWRAWLQRTDWSWQTAADFESWWKAQGRSSKLTPWKNICKEWSSWRLAAIGEQEATAFEQAALGFETLYAQKKEELHALDFSDLESRAVHLVLGPSPGAQLTAAAVRRRYKYVFVDEFQDTSYLQLAFVRFLMPSAEVFLVGDYKQSIYGFRGAEPELFLKTEEDFKQDPTAVRLVLADNFRSDPPILKFTESFFTEIWQEDDFPFDALKAKKSENEINNREQKPERIVIAADQEDDETKDEARLREGAAIAARIGEFHAQGVPYKGMAILFSGMTHSTLYEYALRKSAIPYLSVSGMGFYSQPEVRDLISFLECLQNPLSDVPLAALLRSPFVRISDEGLFWLAENAKTKGDQQPLYDALWRLNEITDIGDSDREKIKIFWSRFRDWRDRKDAGRISDLIEEAVEKSGYAIWALAQASGVRRYGHVKKFIQLARRLENRGRVSAHDFLKLVKRLQFQEVRASDGTGTGDEIDAVRLMTVHKAKGLEFPILFLADLGAQKNSRQNSPVIAVPHEGFALKLKNPLTGKNEGDLFFNQLNDMRKKREDAERKRLFYVAVTRAENKLILSGVWKPAKQEKKDEEEAEPSFSKMNSWMDWVMAMPELTEDKTPAEVGAPASSMATTALSEKPYFKRWFANLSAGKTMLDEPARPASKTAEQILKRVQATRVPEFAKVIDLPVSAYVLFSKDPEEFWAAYGRGWRMPEWDLGVERSSEPIGDREQSSAEKGRSEDSADFGTRMHRALEFMDWTNPEKTLNEKNIETVFASFSDEKKRAAGSILAEFLKTDLFKEIGQAVLVRKELEFVLNARRGLIDGVIDVLYQAQDGTYSVVDYKTAEGDEKKVRERGYDLQIQIYALAAAKILGKPEAVKGARIYFLKNGKSVDVALDGFDKIEADVNELQQKMLEFVKNKLGF